MSRTKSHSASLRLPTPRHAFMLIVFHCCLLLNQPPFINASFSFSSSSHYNAFTYLQLFKRTKQNRGGLTRSVGVAEGGALKKKKKAPLLSWRAITSTLKYSPVGWKMRWYSYDRRTGDSPPPHSSPQSPAPFSIRAEARWTLWICITRKMYWFFIWQKGTQKSHNLKLSQLFCS